MDYKEMAPIDSKCISIVSGKGGSGKTMIAATMASVLDSLGFKVLLIDADYGTAGLTYYMGLNTVKNISVGLTNLASGYDILEKDIERCSQPMRGFKNSNFIGVGDHKRHLKSPKEIDLNKFFTQLVNVSKTLADFILIDCRGGIDDESIAVCRAVDDVVIVAETDTTSFQATQYLVDILYDYDLSFKIAGFLINKVFDDPSTIARAGTSSFKSQYLESVPFDLEATKSFLVGELPNLRSMFSSQVRHALYKLMPDKVKEPSLRSLSFSDYRRLSIRDNDSLLGGMMISFTTLGLGMVLIFSEFSSLEISRREYRISLTALVVLAIFSGLEPARRAIGKLLSFYKNGITRIFFR